MTSDYLFRFFYHLIILKSLKILNKAVLLSLKFRENLEEQIEMYGDYSTMMWFQEHDIIMSESVLIAVAGRGDLKLFRAIINDYNGSRSSFRQDCVEILTDSYIKAAENGVSSLKYFGVCYLDGPSAPYR